MGDISDWTRFNLLISALFIITGAILHSTLFLTFAFIFILIAVFTMIMETWVFFNRMRIRMEFMKWLLEQLEQTKKEKSRGKK